MSVADLNTHIRDNEAILKTSINDDGTIKTVLDRSTTEQVLASSVTLTSVYSFSVPANSLSTNRTLQFKMTAFYSNLCGSASTLAIRGTYGATTFLNETPAFRNFSNGTTGGICLEVWITANGVTNGQKVLVRLTHITDATIPGEGILGNATPMIAEYHSMAEDSTAAKTFEVKVQHGVNNAATIFKAWQRTLQLIGS